MLISTILPLVLGLLVSINASCTDGQDGTCNNADAQSKTIDDVSEMHVELLQRDIKLSDKGKLRTIAVESWKCLDSSGKNTSKAYQSTTASDNSWTKFQVLDMETGEYETQMDVNLNLAPLGTPQVNKIRSMNSCAINPKDSILYCSMEVNKNGGWIGSFLVRIDQQNNIGFVTKLLGFRYAATFDDNDNYYTSGQNQMSIVTGVSTLPAYETYDDLQNYPEQAGLGEQYVKVSINGVETTNYELGADFGILDLPLEGAEKKPYLVSLKDTTLMVVGTEEPYNLFTLPTTLPADLAGAGNPSVWGAAWKWGKENQLYFSQDKGEGLYRLVTNTVVLGQTATLKKVAQANPTDWNDGFSCGDRTPFTKKKDPYPCHHELYQSTTIPYGQATSPSSSTYIKHMDKLTGQFVIDFEVVPQQYAYEFLSMNACAVNPVDTMLYCQLQMTEGSRIARIDSSEVGFVQQSPSWCFAGIFDEAGTYWLYSNNGLYSVADLKDLTGWYSYKIYDVASNKNWKYYPGFSTNDVGPNGGMGADMITYVNGGQTYLVSIVESPDNQISVVDISGTPTLVEGPDGDTFFKAVGLPEPLPGNSSNTWGSAWKTGTGQMLFARDFTGELYELKGVDLATKTATFNATGASEVSYWHDGFSCITNITGVDAR